MMYSQYSQVVPFADLEDPRDTWDLMEKVGEGTYGEVQMAKHKVTGELVAVKILESVAEVVEEVETEYRVLRDLGGHPNIPQFYGIYLKQDPAAEDQIWIVMELCSGGSVTDLVKAVLAKDERMDESLIAFILKETMDALCHLHKNQVIHRDVKGHNILLTAQGEIKVVDFGVSGHLESPDGRRNTSVGTPFWMAPEVIACEQQLEYDYDVRCDVWSLGVTAVELADGEPPMADLHPMRALFKIPRNPPPTVLAPDQWSDEFLDFIAKCVVKDFEQRPSVDELQSHPFIRQVPADPSQLKQKLIELIEATGCVIHEPYVTTKHGRLRSKRKAKREPIAAVDDLATLDNLEEDVIVEHLRRQYDKNHIYTYMGDILLAVNPFCPLTIYSDEFSKLYRNSCKADNAPHIFAIADQSYQAMMHHRHNQCIVISGESGSGKTESANFLVQQLTLLGRAPNRNLEDRILQVNPLVEAFGNAKTAINDNSSRFGKYLDMTFTANGKVTGARLSEYLLEKSRVIHQAQQETSFHIFYYLLDGLSQEDRAAKYHLKDHSTYRYLTHRPPDPDIPSVSINRVKFKTIQRCFETIGFKSQEINSVYSLLVGILHVGNIEFISREENHQIVCTVENMHLIDTIADLLGIDGKELSDALTTSGMVARGETITKNHTIAEAIDVRDAMAKAMYGRLFSWIVNKVNILLRPNKAKGSPDDMFSIGILDIFGFENIERNSFEQLCINIANEQIQYYFNQHIFAWEQQEYKNEGIDADTVEFVDNRPVLDMFLAKPVGLLALLDEESHFPKASDLTLVEKFRQNVHSDHFRTPKSQGLTFTIDHYAGKVSYDASNFLEKNRDFLAAEIVSVLRLSQIALVRALFHSPISKTGNINYNSLSSQASSTLSSPNSSPSSTTSSQSRSQQTVATYFRYSLMDLLSKMVSGTPHFIRCIRPNVENSPGFFDPDKVKIQLRYTGVLETTRIRRQGFSHRIPFSEFLKRYYILGFNFNEKVRVNAESCKTLLDRVELNNWQLGKTKVFLKYYHIEQLSRAYERQQRYIVMAQASIRTWLQRRRYLKEKRKREESAVAIQSAVRGYLARWKLRPVVEQRNNAASRIQAIVRGFIQRCHYATLKKTSNESAVVLQSAIRGFLTRQRVRRMRMAMEDSYSVAATVLQKYFRMWKAQSEYIRLQLYQDSGARVSFNMPQDDDSDTISMSSTEGQSGTLYIPPMPNMPAPPAPSLSEERQQQMQRTHDVKTPWTNKDSTYYDEINGEKKDKTSRSRKEKTKAITTPEGLAYYDSVVGESQKNDTLSGCDKMTMTSSSDLTDSGSRTNPSQSHGACPNCHGNPVSQVNWKEAPKNFEKGGKDGSKMKSMWDNPLHQVQHQLGHSNIPDESKLHRQMEEVDEMFRSVLASSAASHLLEHNPDSDGAGDEFSGGMRKSESEQSLQWDSIMERAREEALAPDRIPGYCESSTITPDSSFTNTPVSSTVSSRASAYTSSDYEYPPDQKGPVTSNWVFMRSLEILKNNVLPGDYVSLSGDSQSEDDSEYYSAGSNYSSNWGGSKGKYSKEKESDYIRMCPHSMFGVCLACKRKDMNRKMKSGWRAFQEKFFRSKLKGGDYMNMCSHPHGDYETCSDCTNDKNSYWSSMYSDYDFPEDYMKLCPHAESYICAECLKNGQTGFAAWSQAQQKVFHSHDYTKMNVGGQHGDYVSSKYRKTKSSGYQSGWGAFKQKHGSSKRRMSADDCIHSCPHSQSGFGICSDCLENKNKQKASSGWTTFKEKFVLRRSVSVDNYENICPHPKSCVGICADCYHSRSNGVHTDARNLAKTKNHYGPGDLGMLRIKYGLADDTSSIDSYSYPPVLPFARAKQSRHRASLSEIPDDSSVESDIYAPSTPMMSKHRSSLPALNASHLYPPEMLMIPSPPPYPPPPIPTRKPKTSMRKNTHSYQRRRKRKKVRFSDSEDVKLDGDTSDDQDYTNLVANSAAIQIVNRIEADGVAYKEELLLEQESLRNELVHSLEQEYRNSFSSRFQRRQKIEHDQVEMEERWRKMSEQRDSVEDDVAYRHILSRGNSRDQPTKSPPLPVYDNRPLPPLDNNNGESMMVHPTISYQAEDTESGSTTPTPDNIDQGQFDFRSVLKPKKRAVKTPVPPKEEPQPPDYRAVLKKRALYPEEVKTKKQIIFKS